MSEVLNFGKFVTANVDEYLAYQALLIKGYVERLTKDMSEEVWNQETHNETRRVWFNDIMQCCEIMISHAKNRSKRL